jgi:hypothetical protein
VTSGSRHRPGQAPNGPRPGGSSRRNDVGLLSLLAACLIGTAAIGVATRDPEPKIVTAVSGVHFPEPVGLQPVPAPSAKIASELGILEPVVYAPAERESEGTAIVGTSEGHGPLLLTGGALTNLRDRDPPQIERLGQSLIAVRVSGQLSAVQTNASGTKADASHVIIYSVPLIAPKGRGMTTTVNVVCVLGSGPRAPSAREACEGLSTTLRLTSDLGHPFELTRLHLYHGRLESILRSYQYEIRLRRELQQVRYASGQAHLAALLAKRCRATANEIAFLIPDDPIAMPALTALRSELDRNVAAYHSLASAAADGNRHAYNKARRRLSRDDRVTQRGLEAAFAL